MLVLLGARWYLLLGQSEEWDVALEAKLSINKSDVIVEREESFVVQSVVRLEGVLPCFGTEEEVTNFHLLVTESLDQISEFNSFFIWWRASFILGAR